MAKQLNIFLENKPGRLKSITEILYKAKINIRAFTLQDRGDFGMMRLITDKPDQAYLALADKGYACALKDILAISIKDRPGNLYRLSNVLFQHKINVVDTYGFVIEPEKTGVCCLEVENLSAIKAMLKKAGFRVLEDDELYEI